jgi:hypothetical protein
MFGRLFKQYIVDNYAKIESGRLSYLRHNQSSLRADFYSGAVDALDENDHATGSEIGKKFILPSSFTGGDRYMQQQYQDAMTIVRVHGKPDLFITFTCNPMWLEVLAELKHYEKSCDRPDLIARIFKLKLKAFCDDLFKHHVLGVSVAHLYVIEFQKRGLPLAHILICLDEKDKINTVEVVNRVVSAQIPDEKLHPLAYATVTKCLMHGPFGAEYPLAACMKDGYCSKHFPKPLQEETMLEQDKYIIKNFKMILKLFIN